MERDLFLWSSFGVFRVESEKEKNGAEGVVRVGKSPCLSTLQWMEIDG